MPRKEQQPIKPPFPDLFGVSVKGDVIYLFGEIDNAMAFNVLMAVHALEAKKKPLHVYINSGGGDVTAGFAIYDTLMAYKSKVTTYATGACMSMAVPIFMAGTERIAYPHTNFMVHHGSVEASLETREFISLAKNLEWSAVRYQQIIVEQTGTHPSVIKNLIDTNSYFSAERAVELKMAHRLEFPSRKK